MKRSPLSLIVILLTLALAAIGVSAQRAPMAPGEKHRVRELARAYTAVVTVSGEDSKEQSVSPFSGFFVDRDLVATDFHGLKDAIKIHVQTAAGEVKDAHLVGVDELLQVAVLRVSGANEPFLEIACPPYPASGSRAHAFAGGSGTSDVTFTGIKEVAGKRYMELDSSIPEYNSGGPILNDQGEVTGIAVRAVDNGQTLTLVGSVLQVTAVTMSGPDCESSARDERSQGTIRPRIPARVPGGVPGSVPGGVVKGMPDSTPMPQVIRKSGGVLQGSALRRAEPLYPPLAKAARVSGSVVVEVTVDEEGDLISARAISGHPLLKDASVNAARGWKFSPTLLQGVAVKVIGTITFNFSIGDSPSSTPRTEEEQLRLATVGATTRPVAINHPRPHYTEEARRNHIEGTVTLRILVGPDGSVHDVKVVVGLRDGLSESAEQAAWQLKFKPALRDGQPVQFWMPILISFNLGK